MERNGKGERARMGEGRGRKLEQGRRLALIPHGILC